MWAKSTIKHSQALATSITKPPSALSFRTGMAVGRQGGRVLGGCR